MLTRWIITFVAFAVFASFGHLAAFGIVTIQTVPVGDPGNTADSTGYGSVSYAYNIGTFEVTASQYTAFLNAVGREDPHALYNPFQADTDYGCGIFRSGDSGNYSYALVSTFITRPVNFVSFWDAARFANWLHNGQPSGPQNASTTEDGAYTLTADGIIANSVTRNAGWKWAVSSEDEWYKAAYYKGGGTNAGYWLYPTRSDAHPGNDPHDPLGNNANYYINAGPGPPSSILSVGEFQNSPSPYGTFDQAGNLWEWNETIFPGPGSFRGQRGGAYNHVDAHMQASNRFYDSSVHEIREVGFRVSQIPAPSSFALFSIGGIIVCRCRRA